MEAAGSPRILQVAIPIFEDVTALDFVGPYESLHNLPNVNVVFVSHKKGLYTADLGMLSIQATATFDEVPSPEVIVVPGGKGTNALMADRPILDWIRKVRAFRFAKLQLDAAPELILHVFLNLIP